jgi:hypothetical protein
MALHGAAWRCMALHGAAWRCMALHASSIPLPLRAYRRPVVTFAALLG